MKSSYKLIVLCLFSFAISCNKLLDVQPKDFASSTNYYQNENELNLALNGIYNRLIDNNGRMYSRGLFSFFAISDEFFYRNITVNNLRILDFDASDIDVGKLWEVLYSGIDRANLLLDHVDQAVNVPQEKRAIIKGEALFLRAYFYFILVDNFGGVPLRLSSTLSAVQPDVPRSSVKDVYDLIVSDMKTAEGLVADISAYPYNERVTVTAVQSILARVFLTMAGAPLNDKSRYKDALEYANKVIASGKHSLNPSYSQVFINHSQDLYDKKECIWEIGMYGNNTGTTTLAGFVGIENGIECPDDAIGYANGALHATKRLYDSYEQGDLRRDWAIAPYRYVTTNGVTSKSYYAATEFYQRTCGKWRREYETITPKVRSYNSTNFPVIRYSDVLLMKAEAENEVTGAPDPDAIAAVNMVRRRGWGKDVNSTDPAIDIPASGMSKEEFFDIIQNERMRELAFEGIRKHDLIRWGIYVAKMNSLSAEIVSTAPGGYAYAANAGKNASDRNLLFPIPNTEMTINSLMKQNPGW